MANMSVFRKYLEGRRNMKERVEANESELEICWAVKRLSMWALSNAS